MAAKSPPAGLGRQISSMRGRNYTTSAFWVYQNLTPDCSWYAKQGYYLHSHLQDSQINRHSVGTICHYLTKSALLPIWSPTFPGVDWLTHALSPPTTLLPWGLPSSCFPVLPPSRAPTGTQRANISALILKAISNYLALHLPLFCITCALLVPTSVESFQQPLPFQRALQTAIYTLNRS